MQIFSNKILEGDGDGEEMSGWESEKKNAEIWSHFSLLEDLYNKNQQSKDIFDFGRNYLIILPLILNIQTSPITF